MNKFFEYEDTPQWFHIRARDTDMDKTITFWLWGDSEQHIRKLLKQRFKDIEWIKPAGNTLPFV